MEHVRRDRYHVRNDLFVMKGLVFVLHDDEHVVHRVIVMMVHFVMDKRFV